MFCNYSAKNKTITEIIIHYIMEKVALVTGSSSGIGYETSLSLAREGYFTYATMRNLEKADIIKKIASPSQSNKIRCR